MAVVAVGSLAGSLQGERPERTGGSPTIRGSEPITSPAKRESGRRAWGGVAQSPVQRELSGAIPETRRHLPQCGNAGASLLTGRGLIVRPTVTRSKKHAPTAAQVAVYQRTNHVYARRNRLAGRITSKFGEKTVLADCGNLMGVWKCLLDWDRRSVLDDSQNMNQCGFDFGGSE